MAPVPEVTAGTHPPEEAPPAGETHIHPPQGPRAHLQMVQVKCWWSSLVPRLICHFWGEREDTGQPRTPSSSAKAANLPWAPPAAAWLGGRRTPPGKTTGVGTCPQAPVYTHRRCSTEPEPDCQLRAGVGSAKVTSVPFSVAAISDRGGHRWGEPEVCQICALGSLLL